MPKRLSDRAAAGREAESRKADRVAVLSLLLVLPAVAAFVVGLFVDGVIPLYLSIGFSALAGILLLLAVRASAKRRRAERLADADVAVGEIDGDDWDIPGLVADGWGDEGEDEDWDDDAWRPGDDEAQEDEDASDEEDVDDDEDEEDEEEEEESAGPAVRRAPSASGATIRFVPVPGYRPRAPKLRLDEPEEPDLPIESYGRLTAVQVVAVLELLDLEELETVREHEEAHAGRKTILKKIDQLLE